VLDYGLLSPPGLTNGDLIINEPGGVLSDVLRFESNVPAANGSLGVVFVYSKAGGGDAADVGFPTANFANTATVTEVVSAGTGTATYTPTSGQPGFVTGAGGPVTYILVSPVTVVLPPTISKAFADSELQLFGASTALSFAITNPNATGSLTGIAFTDTLPAGLVVSTPNGLIGSCGGGAITAVAGSNSISLTGATLAGGATCTFSVNVSGTAVGTFTNTTGPVTASGGTIVGNTATATISVDFLYFYWFFAA
jgi:hypothetical protein